MLNFTHLVCLVHFNVVVTKCGEHADKLLCDCFNIKNESKFANFLCIIERPLAVVQQRSKYSKCFCTCRNLKPRRCATARITYCLKASEVCTPHRMKSNDAWFRILLLLLQPSNQRSVSISLSFSFFFFFFQSW